VFLSLLLILLRCDWLVGIEGAQAAAAPAGEEIGPAYSMAFILSRLELVRDLEEGTEQRSTVIITDILPALKGREDVGGETYMVQERCNKATYPHWELPQLWATCFTGPSSP
jgi:hypothetical protein